MLGIGLWISTKAATREAAGQMAMGTFLPSIFLSGYVFPLDSMPWPLPYCRQPHSHHLDDRRLPAASSSAAAAGTSSGSTPLVLWTMAFGALVFSSLRLQKRL